jgi:deazaflavin-dependent oxidoreductase (nitroreductase family)
MVRIAGEIIIDRPVEEVFDVVADARNEPRYNPRLRHAEQITTGPIGVGTRFRAETMMMGRAVPMTIEFTAFERPRRLASSTRMATMDIDGALIFDPVPGGTRMRWTWNLRPRGLLRLLGPLVARMGRRQEEAIWTGLKRYLETRATGPAPRRAGTDAASTTGGGRHGRRIRADRRSGDDVRPLPPAERLAMRVEHEVDTRSVGFAAWLYRLTRGRIARLWQRRVLLLTTRGRRSGRARTVPLQFFPDGDRMIVVAANSGLPSPPAWYFNLTAEPRARVEVMGRTLAVRAEELSEEEAAAFWPRVLQAAPDYARYPKRTSRRIPLMRLVPYSPG